MIPKTILLVEDDAEIRFIVGKIFQPTATIIDVSNLESATAWLRNSVSDVVITDWHLPDGTATELMPYIDASIPVVIFTASPESVSPQAKERCSVVISKTNPRALRKAVMIAIYGSAYKERVATEVVEELAGRINAYRHRLDRHPLSKCQQQAIVKALADLNHGDDPETITATLARLLDVIVEA